MGARDLYRNARSFSEFTLKLDRCVQMVFQAVRYRADADAVGFFQFFRVEPDAVVNDLDNVILFIAITADLDRPAFIADGDPVLNRVLHQNLDRQRRNGEIQILRLVDGFQFAGEAALLQRHIVSDVLDLRTERDQFLSVESRKIPANVIRKFRDRALSLLGVPLDVLNGEKRVINKMRLDLRKDDALSVLFRDRFLVIADEAQVQPNVIKHAANHHAVRQAGDGDLAGQDEHVEEDRHRDDNDVQKRNGGLDLADLTAFAHRKIKQIREQEPADDMAGIPQGTSYKVIGARNGKDESREGRGQMEHRIERAEPERRDGESVPLPVQLNK